MRLYLWLGLAIGLFSFSGCRKAAAVESDSESSSAGSSDGDGDGDSDTDGDTDTDGDGDTDSDSDGDTNSDSDGDGDTDTDTVTPSDTESDSVESGTDTSRETDIDTASSDTVAQEAVTFTISNITAQTAYLEGITPIAGVFDDGDAWIPASLQAPDCALRCDQADTATCCVDCPYWVQALAVLPGETIEYTWDGKLYPWDEGGCDCGCYTRRDPFAGAYRASVTAYSGVYCDIECADPVESGVIDGAVPEGALRTYRARFDVPVEGPGPTIEITDRDTSCDDGYMPTCRMAVPTCEAHEILAYQERCYRCVNPATCAPWGEPGCRSDDDCDHGETCADCVSGSCPVCSDCVTGCIPRSAL